MIEKKNALDMSKNDWVHNAENFAITLYGDSMLQMFLGVVNLKPFCSSHTLLNAKNFYYFCFKALQL